MSQCRDRRPVSSKVEGGDVADWLRRELAAGGQVATATPDGPNNDGR